MRSPRSVTLLAILVFLLGLAQGGRAILLFLRRNFLAGFNLSLPLPYAIISSALWGGLLVASSFGLWRLSRWSLALTLGTVTLSQAQAWFDRWVFARSDYAQLSDGFALGTTITILLLTWGTLSWQRKRF